MKVLKKSVAFLVIAGACAAAVAADTVVYHVNHSDSALDALRNARNHLSTDPTAKITFVTHSDGVKFLMVGAKAKNDTEYAPLVSALRGSGVVFEVCELTLKRNDLKKDQFILDAEFTPSGVVRLAKLQKQGYAYIKP